MRHQSRFAAAPPARGAARAAQAPARRSPSWEMFRRWRRLGRPIVVAELRELIDCLVPEPRASVDRMREILAAVETAGFAIHDDELLDRALPIPERLALRRMEASLWKERAKLATDLASTCDDDDPQKLRYLQTAKMLLDRANNKAWRVARATASMQPRRLWCSGRRSRRNPTG